MHVTEATTKQLIETILKHISQLRFGCALRLRPQIFLKICVGESGGIQGGKAEVHITETN